MYRIIILSIIAYVVLVLFSPVYPQGSLELSPLVDYRIQGVIYRNPDGSIKRNQAVLSAYKRIHPCPSTGKSSGNCPDWSLNHIIPLSCAGADAVWNLQWVPNRIKTCKEKHCIDRYERKINSNEFSDKIYCKNDLPINLND